MAGCHPRCLGLTRRCLEVLADFRNPVAVVTKNHLVTRDADVLGELARYEAAVVCISVTTLDETLARRMEPRASTPRLRIEAIRTLSAAAIPVAVLVAPVIPALNDHEIPAILQEAAAAGAVSASYVTLRLPWAVAPLFERWLGEHFPDRKEKVLARLREARDGKLYRAEWGTRMRGTGVLADQTAALFEIACRKAGLNRRSYELSTAAFRRPGAALQQTLW